jgi:hypothetical protein
MNEDEEIHIPIDRRRNAVEEDMKGYVIVVQLYLYPLRMKTNDERRRNAFEENERLGRMTIQFNSIQFKRYKLTVGANTVLIARSAGKSEAISVNKLHKEENPSVPHANSAIDVQSSSAFTLTWVEADDANNATTAA